MAAAFSTSNDAQEYFIKACLSVYWPCIDNGVENMEVCDCQDHSAQIVKNH